MKPAGKTCFEISITTYECFKNNLNRELAKAKRWSIEQIEARTESLADDTMKQFSMGGSDD